MFALDAEQCVVSRYAGADTDAALVQVLEENAIVSEITFGETGGGAAMVQGSYVGQDQSALMFVDLDRGGRGAD